MQHASEFHITSQDGLSLYFQMWPSQNPAGNLLITHGHGEHSDSYLRVVEALKSQNLNIFAWDLRGHGRSDGQRGYAPSFQQYVDDYQMIVHHLDKQFSFFDKPAYLLAHSMGGLIQLRTLQLNPQWPITAQILSGPLLDVSVEVPLIKDLASIIANKLFPRLTLGNEIKNEYLSRDPVVLKEYDQDVLRHQKMSPGVYLGFIETSQLVQKYICNKKTLLQIAEHDPVVSSQANQRWFQKQNHQVASLLVYPDRKHEIYNDLDREQVFFDLNQFINQTK